MRSRYYFKTKKRASSAIGNALTFYGVNGHPRQNSGVNQQTQLSSHWEQAITSMVDLGMRVYRCDYGVNYNLSNNPITKTTSSGPLFQQFITQAGSRVQVAPVIDPYRDDLAAGDETAAYNRGFENGADCATYLMGRGIPWIEVGNELDWHFSDSVTVRTNTTLAGRANSDYNNAGFVSCRGLIRGMIAGIKSVDTQNTIPIMITGITSMDIAFLQMLATGTQPDGTTGHPTVQWDLSNWHYYANAGGAGDDPENFNGQYNMLGGLAAFGKPIWITECGANWYAYGASETAVSNAIVGNTLLGKFTPAIRAQYNIKGVIYYQLMDCCGTVDFSTSDEPYYGAIGFDLNNKARYAAMKAFVAAHP
jgi:hypothetical protein